MVKIHPIFVEKLANS